MKQLFASICILAIVGMMVGMVMGVMVNAAEDSVTATVTIEAISIVSVVPSSFDYGSLGTNATTTFKIASSTATGIIVTNGSTAADYKIKGSNTTGGSTHWTLNATAGENQYVHRFEESVAATWTTLTAENQTLKSAVAADGTVEFDLEINTPTISSDVGVEKSVPVTVVAVQPA